MKLENSKFVTLLTEMEKSSTLARDLEGRTLGSVRGTVVDVADPENKGRVKVIVDGFKKNEEESYSYWVDVQVPFRGRQSKKLIGARVAINPTFSDLNRSVISSVIFDEEPEEEGGDPPTEIPGITMMNRVPVYNAVSTIPEPNKENHGCVVTKDRFPMNGDKITICVRNWDGSYSWETLVDIKRPSGGLFGGSFLGFATGLFENGLISSVALSFVTGGIGALVPGLSGMIPGLGSILPEGVLGPISGLITGGLGETLGNIIPGFGSVLGGLIPDLGGFLSSGIGNLTGDLLGQLTELTGIPNMGEVLDMVTGSLGIPSLSSLGDLVTSLPGVSDIIGITDIVGNLEGEILSGIGSLAGDVGLDLTSVLSMFSEEGDLPGFLVGELERLTGGVPVGDISNWFTGGIDSGSDYD